LPRRRRAGRAGRRPDTRQAALRRSARHPRDYAADQTLINYCLRGLGANGPYLYIWEHDNLERAIQALKAAGGDPAQVEGLARLVMSSVRFFAPDARDAALEPQCAAREVEKNVAMMTGLSMPLHLRPPFRNFPR